MRTVLAALMALACGGGAPPVPDITDPSCSWVEVEIVEPPPGKCARFEPAAGETTRFRRIDDDRCGGDTCIVLQPDEQAVIVGPYDDFAPRYDRIYGDCAEVPACP